MSCIKSLDKTTVHRICSGQVIINLANGVKELIENSLDAGAKTIEIRLKNYGSDSIEVIDDGPGINEQDFQAVTLKHYTSKISAYDDLEALNSFGFRGEALSSLCALGRLSIITRQQSSEKATRLEYESSGLIKSKTSCARSPGTTVILENIFYSLPVRHKEFLKNLKREYHKLMHVIQCYCLISEGVKLSCYHIQGDKSTKLMSTYSKNDLKSNIIEIFGLSAINSMVKVVQSEPDEDILVEYKLKSPTSNPDQPVAETHYSDLLQIEGYISSCAHGSGRSAPDRQYIYINKRPCDHSRITKLINEIFHQYNRTQYPMFVLNLKMRSENVDVNVTPDKLQMFIRHEAELLAVMKASLLKMYGEAFKTLNLNSSTLVNENLSQKIVTFFSKKPQEPSSESQAITSTQLECKRITKRFRKKSESDKSAESSDSDDERLVVAEAGKEKSPKAKVARISAYFNDQSVVDKEVRQKTAKTNMICDKENRNIPLGMDDSRREVRLFNNKEIRNLFQNQIQPDLDESLANRIDLHMCNREASFIESTPLCNDKDEKSKKSAIFKPTIHTKEVKKSKTVNQEFPEEILSDLEETPAESLTQILEKTVVEANDSDELTSKSLTQVLEKTNVEENNSNDTISTQDSSNVHSSQRRVKQIDFNLEKFKVRQARMCEVLKEKSASRVANEIDLIKNIKFKTKNIESKDAEKELDRCMTKEDFSRMRICGQFNKGFIVTELDSDLFIIDQHAADEIYNFETLQKAGKIQKQKLLQPKYLELAPSSEHVLIEHLAFLEKSGYEMQVCTNRNVGNRIMLTCVPMSAYSNKLLNLKDIDELIYILTETDQGSISMSSSEQASVTDLKSSSLRAFYASKACRMSIMVGKALNMTEMKRVVDHLSTIEKPYNCPHGRPTLRHLVNLELIKKAITSKTSDEICD